MPIRSTRLARRAGLPLLGALLALAAGSCGGEPSAETVYLYVINGYSGASSLSLYGPTGPIVEDLGFGERNGAAPVAIDRGLGTDFKVVLEGAPQPFVLSKDLFAMYPQETGTLFIKRRTGGGGLETSLFRHIQTISEGCAVTFTNALEVSSTYVTGGEFSFAPEWKMEPPAAGYVDETDVPVLTDCGAMPTPNPEAIVRAELHEAIAARPFFFFSECQSAGSGGGLCPVWGELDLSEQVEGHPHTADYLECVAGAIRFEPTDTPTVPGAGQCPSTLSWDDVSIDQEVLQSCRQPRGSSTTLSRPGGDENSITLVAERTPADFDLCSSTFRLRSPGLDVVFGPNADGEPGEHQNGDVVETTMEIPAGSEHFYVLFGRPVNPRVWQWDSGETFVDLAGHPYPGGQDEQIGDYDD